MFISWWVGPFVFVSAPPPYIPERRCGVEFLNTLMPFSFVIAGFVILFSVLLKALRDERGKNRESIEKLQTGQNNLDRKLDKILDQIAFKEVMERE